MHICPLSSLLPRPHPLRFFSAGLRPGSLRPGLLYRAALEGATFSLLAGLRRMRELGPRAPRPVRTVRTDRLFCLSFAFLLLRMPVAESRRAAAGSASACGDTEMHQLSSVLNAVSLCIAFCCRRASARFGASRRRGRLVQPAVATNHLRRLPGTLLFSPSRPACSRTQPCLLPSWVCVSLSTAPLVAAAL